MEYRMIKSPSQATKNILLQRIGSDQAGKLEDIGAIGLVQGKMIDMVCAADIAEKAAGVAVEDIRGNCPQHMLLLAIFGDTSSVEAAMESIQRSEKGGILKW